MEFEPYNIERILDANYEKFGENLGQKFAKLGLRWEIT